MCPVVLGSRSTYALGALGGFQGQKLEAGDELPVGTAQRRGSRKAVRSEKDCAACRRECRPELRVIPGLYWHRITDAAGKGFFSGHLEGRSGSRPDRLPLQGRQAAQVRAARAAVRRGLRSLQRHRCLLPLLARSRCPEALSRSCCIVTRFQAAATSWSARSFRPTWI